MAALEKVFNCLTCGAQIRLERKADNSGWLKYNLDGSDHVDEKKNKNSQTQHQLTELTKHTITAGAPSVAAHVREHGDSVGACQPVNP
jgi:hypothetical protein